MFIINNNIFILLFSDNAIPIKSWFSDTSDTALLNLLPMLDALRFTDDVRSVLSRNLHNHNLWQWSVQYNLLNLLLNNIFDYFNNIMWIY